MRLDGKIAIVTGAGRGIGRAIALALAREGAEVAVADLIGGNAEAVRREVEGMGRKALALTVDVTQRDEVEGMVKTTVDQFGQLDILVNNAGWDKVEPFMESREETWEKVIAINYKAVIYSCRAALAHMIPRRKGKIVNIGSDAGRVGSSGEAVYSGAKGAVIAFSKTLAREMARHGINVNVVCPGPTDTPLVHQIMAESSDAEKVLQRMTQLVALKRLGKPEEIAAAVVFLASSEADFITGQTLSVSGGLTMI
jgi:2-hydroxycyclohexanecarboxyl-CoA dehydrogenase